MSDLTWPISDTLQREIAILNLDSPINMNKLLKHEFQRLLSSHSVNNPTFYSHPHDSYQHKKNVKRSLFIFPFQKKKRETDT